EPLDGTRSVCEDNGARYISRAPTNVYGDAVRTGIREARGSHLVFMDADGSHSPEFVQVLYERAPFCDVAIASRYVDGGHTENTPLLRFMSRLLNVTFALVLDLDYKDVSNSFKLYRADLLEELDLRCDSFDIIEEILFKIRRLHPEAKVVEIPASFKKR